VARALSTALRARCRGQVPGKGAEDRQFSQCPPRDSWEIPVTEGAGRVPEGAGMAVGEGPVSAGDAPNR
jgi:hypothetical protein